MKRLCLLFFVSVISFSLFGCARQSPSEVPAASVEYFKGYSFSSFDDFIKDNCSAKVNWFENKAVGIRYSTNFDNRHNPSNVTIMIAPVVFVDGNNGYIVNLNLFTPSDSTGVYKDNQKITGQERDDAIKQALQIVDGVSVLKLTFQMKDEGNGAVSYTNFDCSIP